MIGVGQASGLSRAVDNVSAGLFAAASGYSCILVTGSAAGAVAVGAVAFLGVRVALGRIDEVSVYRLPEFSIGQVDASQAGELPELLLTEPTELLLTDAFIDNPEDDALLLEDRLESLDDRSRVIRLFDPRTLPTAGELHERIKGHIHGHSAAYPDATAELHRALADLRSTLR